MKKSIALLMVIAVVNLSCAQKIKKSETAIALDKNINRIELSKLTFFSKELIELGSDTSFQSKFIKKLILYNGINRKTLSDRHEYDLVLHFLYKRIAQEKSYRIEDKNSKEFFLRLLEDKKHLDFPVDERLIIQQLDDSTRGMKDGYDEGTTEESSFIFFCYDPLLYRETLLNNNKLKGRWEKTAVFLCNYLRNDGNPVLIRNQIKDRIIAELGVSKNRNEFASLTKEFAKCDVSVNLFD